MAKKRKEKRAARGSNLPPVSEETGTDSGDSARRLRIRAQERGARRAL